uniref:Putative harbinger transposase-derived nuclease domain-containing protein n=1 Tax=Helianthus annuus TaxID=4232 RepID=A0A251U2D1_HELAN
MEHMFASKYLIRMPLDIVVVRDTRQQMYWLLGTASDSRIIKNALTRDDKLVIPTGRYCLVDAGLPHTSTLMAPYRGVRYHLKEYSTRAPENAKELFNLRHASLRNAIERAFGVLKKRFPIIRSTAEPFYSCDTQSGIFLACCILHNFLLEEDRDKDLEDEVIQEVLDGPQEEESQITRDIREGSTRSEQLRNSIANEMWTNYLNYPNNEIDMSK